MLSRNTGTRYYRSTTGSIWLTSWFPVLLVSVIPHKPFLIKKKYQNQYRHQIFGCGESMIQNKFRYLGKVEIDDTKMGCILFVYDITCHICGNIDMYNIEYFIGTSSGVSVLWYSSITFLILVVTYTVYSSIHLRIGCVLPLENPFPNEKKRIKSF